MELKEFIKQTLSQVTLGIKESQEELIDTGVIIVPKLTFKSNESYYITDSYVAQQQVHEIKFKVAITVEEKNGDKAGLGVIAGFFSAGGQSSSDNLNQNASSIEFSVPVVFPPGNDPKKKPLEGKAGVHFR